MNRVPIYSTILDDEPDLAPVVGRFVARLPAFLDDLDQAWQQQDWARLRDVAHELKGAAGNLGFPLLMRSAALIETDARNQNSDGIGPLLAELRDVAERIAFDP
jgi:two-component system, sensor histidine kinase LadS